MYQLLELAVFDGTIMNQVFDYISISEDGGLTVVFLFVSGERECLNSTNILNETLVDL